VEHRSLAVPILIEKCINREPVAWAEFVQRFSPVVEFSVRKALLKYFPGKSTVEEVKDMRQNIMILLWDKNKLVEIRNRNHINYWLAITARNATINHLKSNLKSGQKEILIGEETYFEKFCAHDAEEISEKETEDQGKKIKAILGILTPREKIMFDLYFKKKLGLKDVSRIMHVPLGTASCAITRMRKKIKCSKTKI